MSFEVALLEGGPPNLQITIEDADENSNDNITSVSAANSTLYQVEVDCLENTGEDVSVRFYNLAAPNVGTDIATVLLKGFKGQIKNYIFKRGIPFSINMSVAVVSDAGATSGATAPSGTVKLRILAKDT